MNSTGASSDVCEALLSLYIEELVPALTFGETTATDESIQREILPIPDRKPIGLPTYDA